MKLHSDLNINQRSAWFLVHRLRGALAQQKEVFSGPVEVDETYFDGRSKNMPNARCKELAGPERGAVDKVLVIGAKDRDSNRVAAKVVESTDVPTLQGFVREHADEEATVYPDEHRVNEAIRFDNETVQHSFSEYVKDGAHTNGIGSYWLTHKRAPKGVFHKFSPKHLDHYVQEFAGHQNLRACDVIDFMSTVATGMDEKWLHHRDFIADHGLSSGVKS